MNKSTPDYRSPLARARGWGSAHSGTHHWFAQRLTALALVPLALWFVWSVLHLTRATQAEVVGWLQSPLHAIPLGLFLATGLWHGTLGIQVVLEDYVTCKCARMTFNILTKFAAILLAVSAIYAILLMSFSGGIQ